MILQLKLQFPYFPITSISTQGIGISILNPRLNYIFRQLFLLEVQDADYYLTLLCIILIAFCFKFLHAFSRPPPVQRKVLPRRPALQILFKPDDISSMSQFQNQQNQQHNQQHNQQQNSGNNRNDNNVCDMNGFSEATTTGTTGTTTINHQSSNESFDDDISSIGDHMSTAGYSHTAMSANRSTTKTQTKTQTQSSHNSHTHTPKRNNNSHRKPPIIRPHDLPDSFAPLLSSSQMEILTDELTCDLLHATQVEGSIRLKVGRHEIPLDKDPSRPQLILNIPKHSSGCKMTAVASIGSDGVSNSDDLDVCKPTKERSLPLVKHAGILLDPPLFLVNVAPTLIHFPTLFEDNVVKYTFRRIQIVRYFLDFISSMSNLIEKVLWILESKCQIHLGKVSITPLYKGELDSKNGSNGYTNNGNTNNASGSGNGKGKIVGNGNDTFMEPQWRLSLAFSGHVLLFGYIPIPFVNITLPTWIIPQPHALLENLLTSQPLASAKLKRERIEEQRITLAVLDAVEAWDFKLKAVATPPALSADLSLSGGISVAVETMHGTDVSGGRPRGGVEAVGGHGLPEVNSNETLSACTMYTDTQQQQWFRRRRLNRASTSYQNVPKSKGFDANELVPWKLELSLNGTIDRDKISVSLSKCVASHDPSAMNEDGSQKKSNISFSGRFVICKPDPKLVELTPKRRLSANRLADLNKFKSENHSVASILLFPEKNVCSSPILNRRNNLLQYDYDFDIGEDTTLDALSLSIGASHPMLKGGTIITLIMENFYAYGTLCARENSVIDMSELNRKRNILSHLPAVGFTAGIQNFFIPEESFSYSDDGQTKCLPELGGGQLQVRVMGGFPSESLDDLNSSGNTSVTMPTTSTRNLKEDSRKSQNNLFVSEGIKVLVDFGIGSFVLNNESNGFEFPELDIFDDQKLQSLLSGGIDGSIGFHLRPQGEVESSKNVLGKNISNPLERYEIEFSGSKVFVKIVEANATLGHRRIIIPSESTVGVSIKESIVDMSFDGSTQCEFHWDFQGASPILQVTDNIGENPQLVCHEDRQQVALLISSLRQGRFNLNVSSVGGLTITQAVTSREHREGLYDWKFFNAIVSPDEHSFDHMVKVLHDKVTMSKILQVAKLISKDVEKILNYCLRQLWRAKEIFDKEGVSDPGKAIPSYKMARLMSLFLCGDDSQVEEILPLVRGAVEGEGIDVLAVKELIRKNLALYDEWAPEIDRAVRWIEVMLGSQEAPKPFVENNVSPLSVLPKYKNQFIGFPSAKELYATLLKKQHLPLDPSFSGLLSRIAPYLSFRQIEYILETRPPKDWQALDIRRLRYVYAVKKKVLDISESYGGLSFMPQSFFVSVFVGEATRASLKARGGTNEDNISLHTWRSDSVNKFSTLQALRQRRTAATVVYTDIQSIQENSSVSHQFLSPAGRIASQGIETPIRMSARRRTKRPGSSVSRSRDPDLEESFMVGDSLLGPQDVAILLQAGLTSSMKGSTVVQLNQRMLLDLMASQPRIFAIAVLAEIGTPGGAGNLRGLTSALMALLDLDQSSFTEFHRLDMHELLESWLPGLTIPRRDDYLAGGRWASQSYYTAIYGVAQNILEDAEVYIAFKGHVQRVRHNTENDDVPTATELEPAIFHELSNIESRDTEDEDSTELNINEVPYTDTSKLSMAISNAKSKIEEADNEASKLLDSLKRKETDTKKSDSCASATKLYHDAFAACREVLQFDKLSFHVYWFKNFYRRNYDALMVKSIYDNIINDVDDVREWLGRLRKAQPRTDDESKPFFSLPVSFNDHQSESSGDEKNNNLFFHDPDQLHEQEIVEEIINLIFFDEHERKSIRDDPLVRLLISNPPGNYDFTIVSAMGVITEGKMGLELDSALARLKEQRNVDVIRADTGTARSFEYNASKIEDAIDIAVQMEKPYGLLGYSQGCANGLFCESLLRSGTPSQQSRLTSPNSSLVCRQLLFSAANGSMHGPAMEEKIHRLIVMCEQFFKYQQGYCSRAFTSIVLDSLTNMMDSAAFQKFAAGGGGTFLHQGSKTFWREAQHLPNVPTSVLRGVLEEHTTPESLQMLSNLLTKQAGSPLHDSQVHVYDAVGRPVYTHNRNSKILKNCDMGGSIQRTHHWSPLADEVKFVETKLDVERGTFLCAKDRHVFPWCDVNARFGFIKYEEEVKDRENRPKYDRNNTDNSWESM